MSEGGKGLEKWQAYVASHIKRSKKRLEEAAALEPAITISRQTGAGAITLADTLADYLNERDGESDCQWTVFEKNLVAQVLEDHGLPKRLAEFMPEDKPAHLKEIVGDMLGTRPQDWELVRDTRDTIYRLGKLGRCIIVGRGANIVTSGLPNVLHLRLIGSLDKRVTRCATYYKITRDEALQQIKKQDRARQNYLRAYYSTDIDDPMGYHLVINVDKFTTNTLVRMIGDMVSGWGEH